MEISEEKKCKEINLGWGELQPLGDGVAEFLKLNDPFTGMGVRMNWPEEYGPGFLVFIPDDGSRAPGVHPNPTQGDYEYYLNEASQSEDVQKLRKIIQWAKGHGVYDVANLAGKRLREILEGR